MGTGRREREGREEEERGREKIKSNGSDRMLPVVK